MWFRTHFKVLLSVFMKVYISHKQGSVSVQLVKAMQTGDIRVGTMVGSQHPIYAPEMLTHPWTGLIFFSLNYILCDTSLSLWLLLSTITCIGHRECLDINTVTSWVSGRLWELHQLSCFRVSRQEEPTTEKLPTLTQQLQPTMLDGADRRIPCTRWALRFNGNKITTEWIELSPSPSKTGDWAREQHQR